jgi:hypothetical protein
MAIATPYTSASLEGSTGVVEKQISRAVADHVLIVIVQKGTFK